MTNVLLTIFLSGRPGSNWPPIAWKAIALPNELLPLINFKKALNINKCQNLYLINT